jgi:hypothetical protein
MSRIAIAFALGLSLALSLFSFSAPRASASGGPCAPNEAYASPVAVWVDSSHDHLRVGWLACATYDTEGPFTFEIWVAPTNQLLLMQAWSDQAIVANLYTYNYARPLIPESSYTFWVNQCFWDGTCTGWSNPITGSFPSDLWWL